MQKLNCLETGHKKCRRAPTKKDITETKKMFRGNNIKDIKFPKFKTYEQLNEWRTRVISESIYTLTKGG